MTDESRELGELSVKIGALMVAVEQSRVDLKEWRIELNERMQSLNNRVRGLELWRAAFMGIVAFILATGGWLASMWIPR